MNDYTARKLIDDSNIPMNLDISKAELKEKQKSKEDE